MRLLSFRLLTVITEADAAAECVTIPGVNVVEKKSAEREKDARVLASSFSAKRAAREYTPFSTDSTLQTYRAPVGPLPRYDAPLTVLPAPVLPLSKSL